MCPSRNDSPGGENEPKQPPSHRVFRVELRTPGSTRVIKVGEDEHILDAAERQGLRLPATCRQGWCITCAARLLAGEVDNSDALRYYPEDREAGFVLLCTARPRSALRIQTHAKEELARHRIRHGLPTPRG